MGERASGAQRSGAARSETRERSELVVPAWLPVQAVRLLLGMAFLPFQEFRIPGMDVAFISCAMLRQGFRTLNRGMTFPFIRLPCGMVARAQRQARGLCAERPDKGRGRPRMRAAAPMGNRPSDCAGRRLPQGNQRGRSARAMHRFFLAGRKAAERSGAAFRPAIRSSTLGRMAMPTGAQRRAARKNFGNAAKRRRLPQPREAQERQSRPCR